MYTIGGYLLLAGVFTFTFATELAGWSIAGLEVVHPLLSLFLASFFLIGAWGPMLAYTAELFPTEVRGTGFGFASGIGKIASISGPIVAGLLVTWGYFVALTPFAIGMAAGAVLILTWGRRRKANHCNNSDSRLSSSVNRFSRSSPSDRRRPYPIVIRGLKAVSRPLEGIFTGNGLCHGPVGDARYCFPTERCRVRAKN